MKIRRLKMPGYRSRNDLSPSFAKKIFPIKKNPWVTSGDILVNAHKSASLRGKSLTSLGQETWNTLALGIKAEKS